MTWLGFGTVRRLRLEPFHWLMQGFGPTADATTRLLDSLAYLARKSSSQNDPQTSIPPLAQLEIALIAGLARETASRTLSKLRNRGTVMEDDGRLSSSGLYLASAALFLEFEKHLSREEWFPNRSCTLLRKQGSYCTFVDDTVKK